MLRCHAALSLDVISKSWCGHGLGRLTIISLSCHSVPVWSWASILVLWGLDSCLYTEILPPYKVQHPDTAGGRSQVKATSCYTKHHSAIADSMIFVPCSIRKTVPGSCIRGKERNFITVNPFALCLNATENQTMGEKWVNRTSAEGPDFPLHCCSSCSNTDVPANYLPAPPSQTSRSLRCSDVSAAQQDVVTSRQPEVCTTTLLPAPQRPRVALQSQLCCCI